MSDVISHKQNDHAGGREAKRCSPACKLQALMIGSVHSLKHGYDWQFVPGCMTDHRQCSIAADGDRPSSQCMHIKF